MKGKAQFFAWLMFVMFALAVSPIAAAEGDPVYLPGWVAWLMVVIALAVPAVMFVILRNNGRL